MRMSKGTALGRPIVTDHRRQRRSVVVPPSRRRRSALRRVFYPLMLLMGCIVVAVFGLSLYGYMKFTGPGPLATDKTVEVERGGVLGIAAGLEKAGVISSANVFAAAATCTGERGKLKPGEYEFKQAMSMRDVMALI